MTSIGMLGLVLANKPFVPFIRCSATRRSDQSLRRPVEPTHPIRNILICVLCHIDNSRMTNVCPVIFHISHCIFVLLSITRGKGHYMAQKLKDK